MVAMVFLDLHFSKPSNSSENTNFLALHFFFLFKILRRLSMKSVVVAPNSVDWKPSIYYTREGRWGCDIEKVTLSSINVAR